EKDLMKRPPRPPKENLFADGLLSRILVRGALIAGATLGVQAWALSAGYDARSQQTMVFTALCFIQLGNALSVRSVRRTVFSSQLFSNRGLWVSIVLTIGLQLLIVYLPALQPVFRTVGVDWAGMRMVMLCSLAAVVFLELVKYLPAGRKARP
ncbi:MAG TPA: cation-translocating P-type ATPase C-terminal domain-containing protein, partial [Sphingobacteriaceae bacterium]